jgi:hypothetical protein
MFVILINKPENEEINWILAMNKRNREIEMIDYQP